MSTKKIVILRGISGSGKSTYAKKLESQVVKEGGEPYRVSADQYFLSGGGYAFDPAKLPEAHNSCLRRYMAGANDIYRELGHIDLIIVDNTNTQLWEMAPYVAIAEAYNIPYEIVHVVCPVEVALERNAHNVPEDTLRKQADRFEEPLPWWNSKTVSGVEK